MSKAFKPIRETIEHPRRQAARGVRMIRDAGEPPTETPRDIWHWTKRKYRVRAVVLLLVNAVLFAGLGCFTFWLRTGEHTPFGPSYWSMWREAFDPVGTRQITLLQFLIDPIPVDQVPLMLVIVALVLASLTAIPILVSMLYRFPFSLIFTAIIGFVAVLPWLAMTMTFCCFLAGWKRLQFSFRFATALISLLPLVAYYALAAHDASASAHRLPMEMAKLYLPWVLAIVGACMVMAVVLMLAKVVNYRPGAIAPLMTVMFALPVVLFEAKVGQDELYYRLLESEFGPRSKTRFLDHLDAATIVERAAQKRLDELDDPKLTLPDVMEQLHIALQVQAAKAQPPPDEIARIINEDFALQQYEAVRACQDFRRNYPASRYIPNALYLQGQAIDTRIEPNYGLFRHMLIVRHYQDMPHFASESAWQALHDKYPDSPLASVGAFRLAMLKARAGKVDEAIQLLDELNVRSNDAKKETQSASPANIGWWGVLSRPPAANTLDVDTQSVVLEARKLRSLLAENRDPQQNDLALRDLLSFDPHHPMYRYNLTRLLAQLPTRFPLTRLRDNLMVLIARSQPSLSVRMDQLKKCIDELAAQPDSDALPRARIELGVAYQDDYLPDEARMLFEQVQRLHSDSPWAIDATKRLATMGATARLGG